ncbi:hypothetical protein K432DRAFT_467216 [Lepidopterella palustris CBS 459.81]|uniref:Cytochrome P450 n=1 Tax=Lepidopterella palustris CBS 459.81 TaxID=1314670 RepID=A0A8E2E0G1_9PEZI|nr:hypothetical protein K432DRAFT_467216 [Lepidopterella palustris CBS 459.81]
MTTPEAPIEDRDYHDYDAGRRSCPGTHFAKRNQWRIAATVLWAFDILGPLDPVTGEIESVDINHDGLRLLMTPLLFKVRLVPRSLTHEAAIRSELDAVLEYLSPSPSPSPSPLEWHGHRVLSKSI